MRIRDPQLQHVLSTTRVPTVDDGGLLRLLAAMADTPAADASSLLQALSRPGMTRTEQFELVRAGLDTEELADVAALLDDGKLVFTPAGRNFLEALCGRAELQQVAPALDVDVLAGGVIRGQLAPDETVEALNLSTAPTGGHRLGDAVEIGRTDGWGRFQGTLADAQQGDVVRLQTRNAQGRVTSWLNVRVQQAQQADLRAAFVNLGRLAASTRADGTTQIEHASRLPVCEPGATLRFSNPANGCFIDATVDANGRIPALSLNAAPGDSILVAVSDGAGNTDFSIVAGKLTVPEQGTAPAQLADPAALTRDGVVRTQRFDGPTFNGPVKVDDVRQGRIGNCYVPAACAAVAHAEPEAIQDLIRDNGDGSFTVTFHPANGAPAAIRVDGDLYAGHDGRPRYGNGALWFSLVEKALAAWRGSYEVVGQGGSVGQMLGEILGRPNNEHWLRGAEIDATWNTLQRASKDGRAMAAGTYGSTEAARYTNSGVYANHAYSVLGSEEIHGERMVILRNPWGSGEPHGDGKDDGIFRLPLTRFMDLFQVLNVC